MPNSKSDSSCRDDSEDEHSVRTFIEHADAFRLLTDRTKANDIASKMADIVLEWTLCMQSWNFLDCFIFVRSKVAMQADPSDISYPILRACTVADWKRKTKPFRDLSEQFLRNRHDKHELCCAIQRDVGTLQAGLRRETDAASMRACLDRHIGLDIMFCRLLCSIHANGRPMHVSGLAALFLGLHLPHPYTRKWFDLSRCEHLITKLSQLENILKEQAPLPEGWVYASRPMCVEPHYNSPAPQHGELHMPHWHGCARRRVKRTCPIETNSSAQSSMGDAQEGPWPRSESISSDSDSDFSSGDIDVCSEDDQTGDLILEAVSPARTMWQFVYQLEHAPSGAICMMVLQLAWSRNTFKAFWRLTDPDLNCEGECDGFNAYGNHQRRVNPDLSMMKMRDDVD